MSAPFLTFHLDWSSWLVGVRFTRCWIQVQILPVVMTFDLTGGR